MTQRPQRNPGIVWRVEKRRQADVIAALEAGEDAGEQGTVTLIESGMMHQLNLVGGMIWELCDGEHDVNAIVDALGQEFDAPREELADDVLSFIADMQERGWLING